MSEITSPGLDQAFQPECPWDVFDTQWYTATYLRQPGAGRLSDAAVHYAEKGAAAGCSPNPYFDESFYLERYPEIRAAVAAGRFASGFQHYREFGFATHDPHWLFSEAFYRARRPDLTSEVLATFDLRNGYHHFIVAGQAEAISGSVFFDRDAIETSQWDSLQPFSAFLAGRLTAGAKLSWYFDASWYLAIYEEVEPQIASGLYQSALHHFLTNPEPARFNPSPDFDEIFYRTQYPDVAQKIREGTLRCGALHFLEFGRFEDRRPSPWFDPAHYLQHQVVVADIKARLALTGYDHYVRHGRALGLSTLPPPHLNAVTEAEGKTIFARQARIAASQRFAIPDLAGGAQPDISVIIAAYNQFDMTMQTLLSLSASTGIRYEVILIDNASTDEVRRIEAHVTGLRVLHNSENLGFLHAANQGLGLASGRHVLLLNNDVTLNHTALSLACARLDAAPDIGAVGGKVLRTHGLLQEAGSFVFSNGSCFGYGRDGDPAAPEYNFVRDVDFCSGVFLMVRGTLMRELGGLDPAYAPAYCEEVDLCARMWQAGYRVVYDPGVVINHLEFGSSRNPDAPRALMRRNRDILVERQRVWLSGKTLPDLALALHARSVQRRTRVLFIEDTVPYNHIGSGFPRAASIVQSLVDLGCDVTVFPMNAMLDPPVDLRQGFAETVEVLWDRDLSSAPALFAERETFYDVVWLSRAHNFHRLASVLAGRWGPLRHAHVILDTEALGANREAAKAMLAGTPFDADRALRLEMKFASFARDVIAVNQAEADQLSAMGLQRVHVLGHGLRATPTPRLFADRCDILALGSLYSDRTPNFDGLRWFIDEVWPLIHSEQPEARLLIAGFTAPGLDVATRLHGPNIEHLGFVANTAPLFDQARVFVAPTRYAAGISQKLFDAAAHGLPAVATTLLESQLDWEKEALLAHDPADPQGFADAVLRLYRTEALWQRTRDAGLRQIETKAASAHFTGVIERIIGMTARQTMPR